MRTFILLTAASVVVAFSPPQRMLGPATQMNPVAAAPVATSRTVHKSNRRGARHRRDVSTAPDSLVEFVRRSRASTALAAAHKKTADMTEEEKAAEKALNQQLLVAKGVLFAAVIGYFAFTSL